MISLSHLTKNEWRFSVLRLRWSSAIGIFVLNEDLRNISDASSSRRGYYYLTFKSYRDRNVGSCSARMPEGLLDEQEVEQARGTKQTFYDNDGSPVEVLCFLQPLMFGKAVDRYICLLAALQVGQALVL